MRKTSLSIIIPVYNEEESLVELQQKLETALKKHDIQFESIYVDDGSSDTSFKVLRKIKRKTKHRVKIVRLRKNMGKSAAMAVGFTYASYQIVVTIDADLQDDPGEIVKLLKKYYEGYDLVCGWRALRKDAWHKKILSQVYNTVLSKTTGVTLHDFNTGLKLFSKKIINEIELYGELHRFIPVLAASRGFKVTEVVVKHHKRKHGKSKYGPKRIFKASLDFLVTLFFISFKRQPMQLFGFIGGVFTLIAIIILLYLSLLHFMGYSIGTRPLLLGGALLLLFGIQLALTGLVAELVTSYNQKKELYPIDMVH